MGLWPAMKYAGPFALVRSCCKHLACTASFHGIYWMDVRCGSGCSSTHLLIVQAAIFMGLLMAHHLLPSAWKRALLRGA